MYMTTAAKGNNKTLFSAHSALSAAHAHLALHHASESNSAFAKGDKVMGNAHLDRANKHQATAANHRKVADNLYNPGLNKSNAHSKIGLTVGTRLMGQSPRKAVNMIKSIHKTMGTGSTNTQQDHPSPAAPTNTVNKSSQRFLTPHGMTDGNGNKVASPKLSAPIRPVRSKGGLVDSKGNPMKLGHLSAPIKSAPKPQGGLVDSKGNPMNVGSLQGKSMSAATAHYAKSHAHQAMADHHQGMADAHKSAGHAVNPAPASQHGSMFAKMGKLFKKSVGNKVSGAANFLKNTAGKGHAAIHSYLDKKLAA